MLSYMYKPLLYFFSGMNERTDTEAAIKTSSSSSQGSSEINLTPCSLKDLDPVFSPGASPQINNQNGHTTGAFEFDTDQNILSKCNQSPSSTSSNMYHSEQPFEESELRSQDSQSPDQFLYDVLSFNSDSTVRKRKESLLRCLFSGCTYLPRRRDKKREPRIRAKAIEEEKEEPDEKGAEQPGNEQRAASEKAVILKIMNILKHWLSKYHQVRNDSVYYNCWSIDLYRHTSYVLLA